MVVFVVIGTVVVDFDLVVEVVVVVVVVDVVVVGAGCKFKTISSFFLMLITNLLLNSSIFKLRL